MGYIKAETVLPNSYRSMLTEKISTYHARQKADSNGALAHR